MFAVLLILGMFMEHISMMLLTVPIFFPLATSLGFDPVWFGLIMLLALEISFTTPPFGLLLFVMKGVAPSDTTMRDIYLEGHPIQSLFTDGCGPSDPLSAACHVAPRGWVRGRLFCE